MAADEIDAGGPGFDVAAAAGAGDVVAWEVDLRTGAMAFSPALGAGLGIATAVRSQADLARLVHPDDFGVAADALEHAVRSGAHLRLTVRVETEPGLRWVEVAGRRVGRGTKVTGTLVDVTDRVLAEAATMNALARAQEALGLLDAVGLDWDLDAATVVATVYGSASWTKCFGEAQRSEAQFLDLLDGSSARHLRALVAAANPMVTVRLRLAAGDGVFELASRWVRRSGPRRRWLGVAVDSEGSSA